MQWRAVLEQNAAAYARVAIENIGREFPNGAYHEMTGPGDLQRRPAERNPVFYGSYDWHSCVEMHWLLIRLLRAAPGAVPAAEIRELLGRQFAPDAVAAEADYVAGNVGSGRYGWGWALALVHEAASLDDEDGRRWATALAPLGEAAAGRFLGWLPKATYPDRYGTHQNSAFAFSRSLPWARTLAAAGDGRLADAIGTAARRWFGADADCPGGWEPSGSDFLSPALVEAELMSQVLPGEAFARWLTAFLPGIADGEPAALFTPAHVSDSADGWIAHLHGLNASRAWCWRTIAGRLPGGDDRIGPANSAAEVHAEAALPHVVGDHYMVEHWLAAYAVLLLT